ncbi:hypothetical protein EON83_06835 [bacterium]|nr:MAG: hypothetical protein EON83_06835 [bacterium]
MPKYIFGEEFIEDWASYAKEQDPASEVDEQISRYKREPDGQLSEYEPAQCPLNQKKLQTTAQLALQELIDLGVTQMTIRYDGGSDEGFTHFQAAKTATGELSREEIITSLQNGPLGQSPATPFYYRNPTEKLTVTRQQWTEEALELFIYELGAQLLGDGFGTGEYSLEGSFIADFQTNLLTDIPPQES